MKHVLVSALAVAGLALAGCGSSSSSSTTSATAGSGGSSSGAASAGGDAVTIKDFAYGPSTLTVKAGTEVTFTNEDSSVHTVTDSGKFDSGNLTKGQSYTYTFSTPGTYDYICSIHNYMKATVTVQ